MYNRFNRGRRAQKRDEGTFKVEFKREEESQSPYSVSRGKVRKSSVRKSASELRRVANA